MADRVSDKASTKSEGHLATEQMNYVVKTATQLGAEAFEQVLVQTEASMTRTMAEQRRFFDEATKLGEAQMQRMTDFSQRFVEGARRMQKAMS